MSTCRDNEDGRIHEQCAEERDDGVDDAVPNRTAHSRYIMSINVSCEDEGGVEEEIVGHDRRSYDACYVDNP